METFKLYVPIAIELPFQVEITCPAGIKKIKSYNETENGQLLLALTPAKIFTKKILNRKLVINNGDKMPNYRSLGKIEVKKQTLSVWLEKIK